MPLKLLAVGDMHLGRRPSRLPRALAARARAVGPAGAWARMINAAIDSEVEAVALAGDVVERENDFFEAYRELYRGLEQLAAAGIRLFGVVGNHDVAVLPRLARHLPAFELLGTGGTWQSAELAAGEETLALWGWSFPKARVTESPLRQHGFERRPGPNLGLLHCDRDQAGSPYAPVSSLELESAGLDGWLLGHIHQPDMLTAPYPSGYLGSVTGMDPGEPGARGPWLINVHGGRISMVEHWVLAPLRWERIEIDIEGVAEPEEARGRLLEGVRELDAGLSAGRWPPEAVGLRVVFVGRSRFGEAVMSLLSDEDREHLHAGENGIHYFIERVESAARPEIPLGELAGQSNPAGVLARRLLLLDRAREDPERQALLADTRRYLEAQAKDARWSGLRLEPPDENAAAELLRRSGMRLLNRMLAQRETAK